MGQFSDMALSTQGNQIFIWGGNRPLHPRSTPVLRVLHMIKLVSVLPQTTNSFNSKPYSLGEGR